MSKRMLINARHPEECRIAIADEDHLLELEIERADSAQQKGNIYQATITRIEPSLQAAFLDIGSLRNGFLQINDINPAYFRDWPPEDGGRYERPSIQDVLRAGQQLVVQVVKDERDLKGATLTTNLSIPGRYLVLMIGNQRGGVSRKINDESQRFRLKQVMQKLVVPIGMGVIVRTAGMNRSSEELQADLDGLLEIWYEILRESSKSDNNYPKVLYKESDLAIRTVRDYLTGDIAEILIDEPAAFARVKEFVDRVLPSFSEHVIHYSQHRPLFSNFHLDSQVDAINHPEVTLPSGGSIVINTTEAIVAIDVNSGRSTGQADVEETAFATNREAAETIARQLRLRDLGGLVVIDFIDMGDKRHKQIVERTLKDAVRHDKAKVELGRISKFGLLEMSRQRMKTSLASQSHVTCPNCTGRGRVKTPESAALEALRKIESIVFSGGVGEVRVRMNPAAALFLLNEKRHNLSNLEDEAHVHIKIFADGRLKPEEYELALDTGKREGTLAPESSAIRPSESPRRDGGKGDDRRGSYGDRRGGRRDNNNRNNRRNDGYRSEGGRSEGGRSEPGRADEGRHENGRPRGSRRSRNRRRRFEREPIGREGTQPSADDTAQDSGGADLPLRPPVPPVTSVD